MPSERRSKPASDCGGEQRVEIGSPPAFDVLDRDATTVEVARRLHERIGPRIDAWGVRFHGPSLRTACDRQLVLGVADALLELPAVGVRRARIDALELRSCVLELLLRPLRVDLAGIHGVVDEREGAVLLDLEEPCAPSRTRSTFPSATCTRVEPAFSIATSGAWRASTPISPGGTGHDDHLREAFVRQALRRHERDLERLALVGHAYDAATASASASSVSSAGSGSSAASGTVTDPCAAWIASSIVPTM